MARNNLPSGSPALTKGPPRYCPSLKFTSNLVRISLFEFLLLSFFSSSFTFYFTASQTVLTLSSTLPNALLAELSNLFFLLFFFFFDVVVVVYPLHLHLHIVLIP